MPEPKKVVRWLRVASILQSTLIFLFDFMFNRRIDAVRGGLQSYLYQSEVNAAHVNKVNNGFDSLTTHFNWIFLAGILLTLVAYFALESLVKRNWPRPVRAD